MILLILGWPLLTSYSPTTVSDLQSIPPSAKNWFGTDVHGRDLLTRIFYGARISLLVGAVGAAVSLVIGVLWGALAGYLGGRWDSLLMRIVDILYSMPSIVFVIVLITTLAVPDQRPSQCPQHKRGQNARENAKTNAIGSSRSKKMALLPWTQRPRRRRSMAYTLGSWIFSWCN